MTTIINTLTVLIALPIWLIGSVAVFIGNGISAISEKIIVDGFSFWDDVFNPPDGP